MNCMSKYKFVAAVFGLFLVPFLVLSGHFMNANRQLGKKDALSYIALRTRTMANITADLLTLNYNVSGISSGFIGMSAEARKKALEQKIKENPSIYSEFSILNVSGKEVLKAGPGNSKAFRDYSGTEIFRNAVADREASGAVEYGEYTPPALVLVEPIIRDRNAKPEIFLLARMSLAYLGEVVRVMGRNSSGSLGFIDAGGQMISDSMGRAIISPGIKAPAEVLRAVATASAGGLADFKYEVISRGRPYLISVSNIPGTRWWIFEILDADRPLNRSSDFWAKRVVLIGIILILAFAIAAYQLALIWIAPKDPSARAAAK